MVLIAEEDVYAILDNTPELSPYVYDILNKKLLQVEQRATYRECDGSFGYSMGDCSRCRRFVISCQIGDKLASLIDKFDKHVDRQPEVIRDWIKFFRYKLFAGKHASRKWRKDGRRNDEQDDDIISGRIDDIGLGNWSASKFAKAKAKKSL